MDLYLQLTEVTKLSELELCDEDWSMLHSLEYMAGEK